MSEMIRKITGIGSSSNVNYIPVVYYCVCNDEADTLNKTIQWIGQVGDNEEVDSSEIELYKGLTLAILFVNGIEKISEGEAASDGYTIRIGITDYPLMLDGESKVRAANPNTAMMFEFDGEAFRLVNGFLPYVFDEFKVTVEEDLESVDLGKVNLESGETEHLPDTGDETHFVFVRGRAVTKSSTSVGDDKIIDDKVQPVWLNEGGIAPITSTVGSDVQPLKLVDGSFTSVAAPLATKQQLDTEAIHVLDLDPDTFVLKALDANTNILSSVDLPLETMVVGARYEDGNIILSLKNGQDSNPIPVSDLVNGLVKDPEAKGAGSEQVPVYVDGHGSVQEATKVIARASTDPVGSASIPVYVDANGVITATSKILGTDTTPLKMVNGALTPINVALATAADLAAEVSRAQGVESGHEGRISALEALPPSDNYYHNAGTYNFAAANSTSGLTASISGTGIGAITLNIPIYWGTATPTMSNAPTGAIYLKLE